MSEPLLTLTTRFLYSVSICIFVVHRGRFSLVGVRGTVRLLGGVARRCMHTGTCIHSLQKTKWSRARRDPSIPADARLQKKKCPPMVVCSRYLHSKGVDFTRRNRGGNDPLSHAVAYGRRDIAAWLLAAEDEREEAEEGEGGGGETTSPSGGAGEPGTGGRVSAAEAGRRRRRRDDPRLLDLARLTGDEEMQAFLLQGHL